jgi:hypothetical protein
MCTIHTWLDILSRVPFFADLSGKAMAEVNQLFHEHGYEPGQPTASLSNTIQARPAPLNWSKLSGRPATKPKSPPSKYL